jgi:hypothetical protein
MAKVCAGNRMKNPVPVCSGISGLGKPRLFEEGSTILRRMLGLEEQHVASVIVPYYNGFTPHRVEQLMPIEASFSWRLLYRFFLDNNCSQSFSEWMGLSLPANGGQLMLARAIKTIELKLRQMLQVNTARLYLFLGVDEYQAIEWVPIDEGIPKFQLCVSWWKR